MIVIFDLDYTLLDSKKFRQDLASVFDMNIDEFNKYYEKYFKSKSLNYGIEEHLKILKKQKQINFTEEKKIKQKLNIFFKKMDDYLFPGVEKALKYFRNNGNKLILISFGNLDWQKLKIDNLKIKKYFDKIILEDSAKGKNDFLKSLKNSQEKILIINDNAKETFAMAKLLGKNCKFKIIQGPYSYNIKHKEKIYNDFENFAKEEIN
ncbi:MAG: HAD hydrolase-like protein [Xanthomonadaceae bacterium]|nr:HAD hydrolase-like protein [Rhodospirillaceae bacterium]NIA17597.1 HAD hydrolase-like protein [Xanthomonadaceae bacterium]